jgi:dienelactone hydrolase
MRQQPTVINEYQKSTFGAPLGNGQTISHDIYQRGAGAPIILIQELPGIGVETLRLADEFVDAGFRVVIPHLFGPIGKVSMVGNLVRVFCMRKEFHLFQANRSSPIVDWLKALCRDVQSNCSAPGVGVIGMCLTGNFAISLMADDSVLAAVASQPAMPIAKQGELHMSDDDIDAVKRGIDAKAPMQAFRFEGDPMCTAAKFSSIDAAFNQDGKSRVELHTLPGKQHSVLTLDFVDEAGHPTRDALDNILAYFRDQLAGAGNNQ